MSEPSGLCALGVRQIVDGIRSRQFTAQEVVGSCLARIQAREPVVKAWAHLDEQAYQRARQATPGQGPLGGVPFGIKDVIDSSAMLTEMGSKLYSGHQPRYDASCVAIARAAGAIALGMTVSAEFAGTQPTRTTNPHDPGRTPGGSSSGSAAAVADFMVPFAFGTQTGGSVLRPAAFCGIVGFKPSFGLYSTSGTKVAAHSFDTIGLFAREVTDIALLHAVMMNTEPVAPTKPGRHLRLGVFRSHLWDTVHDDAKAAFEMAIAAAEKEGATLVEISTPEGFERITEHRAVINAFERARGLSAEWSTGAQDMSPQSSEVYRRGVEITGDAYVAARRRLDEFRHQIDHVVAGVDTLITPTTPGEAPEGLSYAGDPRLQELWTMLHLPSITIPFASGVSGLPLGLQMVAARYADADLVDIAGWFSQIDLRH